MSEYKIYLKDGHTVTILASSDDEAIKIFNSVKDRLKIVKVSYQPV